MSLLIKGVTAHTALTDKDPAGTIDHANLSVSDAKIASGVGTADTQLLKLPVAADNKVIKRSGGAWGAGDPGIGGVKVRINSQMPILGTRPQLNFLEGAAIGLDLEDNPADDEIDVTVSAKYPTQFITLLPDDAALPTVNPAALSTVVGTNFVYKCLDFDPTTEESAYWEWFLTPDYLSENIVVDIYWISAGAGDVKFGFSVLGREKGETWDSALGVERTVVQTNAGAGLMNKARITTFAPGWSPGDVLLFKLARKAADAADTIDANDVRVLKVAVSYTGQFAQAFYPLAEAVEVIPAAAAGAWTDVDVSAYVPTGATGVILHYMNVAAGDWGIGFRKKGSTDNRTSVIYRSSHNWAMIGIDENRKFQAFKGVVSEKIYLVGYTATGAVFFDNAYDKSLGVLATWTDINVAAECPGAIGVIVEILNPSAVGANLRNDGSTDNRYGASTKTRHSWAIIGCTGQIFEGIIGGLDVDFFVVGYITQGAVFKVNASDKSLGVTGAWTDIDCSVEAPSAIMLFIEVGASANSYGLRKNGSAENIYWDAANNAWGIVPCDSGQKIEGEIEALACDFFVLGYATWAGA